MVGLRPERGGGRGTRPRDQGGEARPVAGADAAEPGREAPVCNRAAEGAAASAGAGAGAAASAVTAAAATAAAATSAAAATAAASAAGAALPGSWRGRTPTGRRRPRAVPLEGGGGAGVGGLGEGTAESQVTPPKRQLRWWGFQLERTWWYTQWTMMLRKNETLPNGEKKTFV